MHLEAQKQSTDDFNDRIFRGLLTEVQRPAVMIMWVVDRCKTGLSFKHSLFYAYDSFFIINIYFTLSLLFIPGLQSAFHPQSAFYPRSAVCIVHSLRFTLTGLTRITIPVSVINKLIDKKFYKCGSKFHILKTSPICVNEVKYLRQVLYVCHELYKCSKKVLRWCYTSRFLTPILNATLLR